MPMSYSGLADFRQIFQRKDFDFIADFGKISQAVELIRSIRAIENPVPASSFLRAYRQNLVSFYSWLNAALPDAVEGFKRSLSVLTLVIEVLEKRGAADRSSISGNYLRGFEKDFLSGLSALLSGIRAAFDPDILSAASIDSKQIVRYVFDKKEGLGSRFVFNRKGKHAFAGKLLKLDKPVLVFALRALLRAVPTRARNGWLDLGFGGNPVRILTDAAKKKVYFLFRVENEHSAYMEQFHTPIGNAQFEPL